MSKPPAIESKCVVCGKPIIGYGVACIMRPNKPTVSVCSGECANNPRFRYGFYTQDWPGSRGN